MNHLVIGAGTEADRNSIPLATRVGRRINNERRMERNPAALAAAARIWTDARPGIRLRSLTARYNCMGMVFAARRVWVDVSDLHRILAEDGYRRLREQRELQIGDIVVYAREGTLSHVAVVARLEPLAEGGASFITMLSQWGADGEFFHGLMDVPPLCGEPSEFWTDRS
jgi:hypothetical protein